MATAPPSSSGDQPARAAPAPGARHALVLLLLINLMNYIDRQILSQVESQIGAEYGVGPDVTGWLATVFLLSYMVCSPVFGLLADRISRWAIVGIGVIVWSLASGGSGAVQTFGMLVVMRILVGIGEAAYGPVAPTIIADLYPVSTRGKVLAWFYAAIPVGSALGYIVGAAFGTHWHWAFYVTVPPGLLLGAWCFFMREPRAHRAHAIESAPVRRKTSLRDYLQLLHIRSYVLNTIGMTAMTFAIGGIAFFMPRYLKDVRGQGQEWSGLAFGAIVVVAGLLATILGGIAGDKLRARYSGSYFLVSGAGMLLGFPFFLLMLVTPFPACWAVIFVAVFWLFFNTGPSNTIIANVTAPGVRATAYAVNILVIHALGDAISPPIIGFVARHWSLDAGFVVVSLMMVLGGVVWLCGARYLAADTARAEELSAADGRGEYLKE